MKWVLLDRLLEIVHLCIIGFNLLGWISRKTRRWHLLLVLLTLFSWLVLGLWFGFGYCFLTDWHWAVKKQLGIEGLPPSYIEYFLERVFPIDFSHQSIYWGTAVGYGLVILLSVWLNYLDYKKRHKKSTLS